MLFVGVDPGKRGAIAFLDAKGWVMDVMPTPMLDGGKNYDLAGIAAILRDRADPRLPDRGLFVTIERLHPMPMRFARKGKRAGDEDAGTSGVIANYNRGVAQGWAWMLAAFRIPYMLVLPRVWQGAMLKGLPGNTKEQSIARARDRWPHFRLRRTALARTDDDGIADALNLAEYGRTQRLGGEVFAKAGA